MKQQSISRRRLMTLFRRFSPCMREDITKNILNMVAVVLATLVGVAIIWMVGKTFDALNNSQFDNLPSYILIFISLVVILQLLRYVNFYLFEWMQQRVIHLVRREVYQHLLELSVPYKNKVAAGDILTRLSQDVTLLSELLVIMPVQLFSFGITLILYVSVLFYVDSLLAAVVLAAIPLLLLQQRYFLPKTRGTARDFLKQQGAMSAYETESLSNIQGIASFFTNAKMLCGFDLCFSKLRRAAMHNLLLNNLFVVSFELVIAVAAVVLVAVGVFRISQQALTLGGLVNFLLYLGYLSVPLRGLAKVPVESQMRASAAERVADILDAEPDVKQRTDALELGRIKKSIEFNAVNFSYPGGKRVLCDFNLNIHAGEVVAIMGQSGIGKTSIARLLMRLYDPQRGKIMLDGIDIRDLKISALRSQVAVVWQEPFLIDDSVFNNLLMCVPDATEEQMLSVLQQAHADKFIANFPQGNETHLGPHGGKLSAGQKQRLAIAQALLRKPSLLILDEATSGLDSESEVYIRRSIMNYRQYGTVIIIAHRMSTVMDADRIVYMERNGMLVSGTYNELKEQHEAFRQALSYQQSSDLHV